MTKSPTKSSSPILSVIILNYNANKYLSQLYDSIVRSKLKDRIEVILADNSSTDGSFQNIQNAKHSHPKINFIFHDNKGNIGFSAGNNRGLKASDPNSKYVLFLNPDTTVKPNTFQGMVDYFETHPHIDSATCDVILALTGKTQPECHRGFPTPWNAFCHFFLPFSTKIFPRPKIFNGYFLGHLDYSKIQPIDSCVGAFLMLKRSVGDKCKWWSEKYFMYGEDIDFSYQIKKNGFTMFFIPDYQITHYQGISSGIKKAKSAATRETKVRSAKATTNAMRIFYRENLIQNYPPLLQFIVWRGIDLLEFYRIFKAKYL
jgi:GT2 family glycosyltransferase